MVEWTLFLAISSTVSHHNALSSAEGKAYKGHVLVCLFSHPPSLLVLVSYKFVFNMYVQRNLHEMQVNLAHR